MELNEIFDPWPERTTAEEDKMINVVNWSVIKVSFYNG